MHTINRTSIPELCEGKHTDLFQDTNSHYTSFSLWTYLRIYIKDILKINKFLYYKRFIYKHLSAIVEY